MPANSVSKVGIVALIALTLLGILSVWKSDIFLTGQGYEVIGSFENIEGLTLGSEVRFRGSKVGKVMKLDPGPYDIKIFFKVERDLKIPADSTLRVAYDGIVGMKYLEIRPGTSEVLYSKNMILGGTRTASLVDFIDIGSKNLVETKAILEAVRKIIENPNLQRSFVDAVLTADKTANEAEQLVKELREISRGINNIVGDEQFQKNVKGTMGETEKTLSSANRFFEGIGKVNLRISGGVDLGTRSNAVKGNLDVLQNETSFYRIGFGEGPARQMSLLDFLITNYNIGGIGYRLGVINNQLGGGIIYSPSSSRSVMADIYDINNPKPNNPKVRLGYEQEIREYLDVLLQGDDLLNSGNRNIMLGIRVKPAGEKIY